MNNRRPHPFIYDHEWVDDCATCPFDHAWPRGDRERHCRKCGITPHRARDRQDDIAFEACPMREVSRCRKCGKIAPISGDSSPEYSLCTLCQHPHALHFNTATEAVEAIRDINAGKPPEPPSKRDKRPS